jgi:glycosyltransferase involved in cell wall biosynthesis
VFVRLAHALRDQPAVHFVMVGAPAPAAGNRAWRDALHRDMQNADNLEYLGRKSQDEVNALLARAHIFVNTSTHEGFPNTFIQAWLRDAVVVSLSVDPDHVLERQQVGIAARTEQALIGAVRDLIAAPAARAAYADRARRHAQQHHSLRNAQDLVALIDQFQSASRGRGAAS